jgi:hypothetical protein
MPLLDLSSSSRTHDTASLKQRDNNNTVSPSALLLRKSVSSGFVSSLRPHTHRSHPSCSHQRPCKSTSKPLLRLVHLPTTSAQRTPQDARATADLRPLTYGGGGIVTCRHVRSQQEWYRLPTFALPRPLSCRVLLQLFTSLNLLFQQPTGSPGAPEAPGFPFCTSNVSGSCSWAVSAHSPSQPPTF